MKTAEERRKRDREIYAKNRKAILVRKRAYRIAHPPRELSEQEKASRNARGRERYYQRREQIAKNRRALRAKDPQRFRRYFEKWVTANKEKWRESRRRYQQKPENKKKAKRASARWLSRNKAKAKAASQRDMKINRKRRIAYAKKWNASNRERVSELAKARRIKNPEKFKQYRKTAQPKVAAYMRERRRNDPGFRLAGNLRSHLNSALKGRRKAGRTLELLGCSIESFWLYLESKFHEGMTRENYCEVWEVDHILPCAIFDLTKPDHQRRCFHYSNLQPLFCLDNQKKGAKVPEGYDISFLKDAKDFYCGE